MFSKLLTPRNVQVGAYWDRSINQPEVVEAGSEDEHAMDHVWSAETAELAFKKDRRAHYRNRKKAESNLGTSHIGKGRPAIEVGSPMGDFINAHVCVRCRRIVPEVYFGNDRMPVDSGFAPS